MEYRIIDIIESFKNWDIISVKEDLYKLRNELKFHVFKETNIRQTIFEEIYFALTKNDVKLLIDIEYNYNSDKAYINGIEDTIIQRPTVKILMNGLYQ